MDNLTIGFPLNQPEQTAPSVFQFLDAREYLRKAYDAEKLVNKKFSHRYIAKAMNAGSSSFFRDLLHGKARLSPARTMAFARIFRLSARETDHFENLVHYTQAETPEEKERYLRKLGRGSASGRQTILQASQAEYLQKWHYAAIRELLAILDFRGDYEALAKALTPPIRVAEARDAVQLLLRLKLIRKNPQGRFEKTNDDVSTGYHGDPGKAKPGIRANLELALQALDSQPAPVRPFSYLTVCVSEKSFLRLRDKLRGIRKEILEDLAEDKDADRLYQLNFQLFPVSHNVKRSRS